MSQFKNFVLRRLSPQTELQPETPESRYGRVGALLLCIGGAIYLYANNHDGAGALVFLAMWLA